MHNYPKSIKFYKVKNIIYRDNLRVYQTKITDWRRKSFKHKEKVNCKCNNWTKSKKLFDS